MEEVFGIMSQRNRPVRRGVGAVLEKWNQYLMPALSMGLQCACSVLNQT